MRKVVGGVVVVLLLFGACGGDGADNVLEAYFDRVEEAAAEYDRLSEELNTSLEESPDPVTNTRRLFVEGAQNLETFVTSLEALDAPPRVAAEHESAVSAGREALAKLRDAASVAETAEDPAELQTLVTSELFDELSAVGRTFQDSCRPLQDIADAEDINVDLRCAG